MEVSIDRSAIERQIFDIVGREGMIDTNNITRESTLEDLGMSSMDSVMILMALEEQLGVYIPVDEKLTDARTVTAFVDVLVDRVIEDRKSRAG